MNPNEKFITTKLLSSDLEYGVYGFYSKELDMRLVKSLIGKPGDNIELKDGVLIWNRKLIEKNYILYNSYFFLGDTRNNSIDTRFWTNPYIDRNDIIGKVLLRIHPYFKISVIK